MYHNNRINQVSKTNKSLLTKSFSQKDSQIDHYTATQLKISQYIRNYQRYPWIKLSNKRIANAVGCSVITVIRATNKFQKDGFITKYQENQYTSNNYTFGMIVDHKNKRIFQSEYDTPNKSNLILDSLFRRVYVSYTHTRDNIQKKIKRILKKGEKMNAVQKQMILNQRNNPKLKEIINSPKIMERIITPTIEKIAKTLTLDEKERFKLVAFTEETLEHVQQEIEYAIASKKVPHAPNRMEWILLFATQYCANNNMKPDWKWYYYICDILGISIKPAKESSSVQRGQCHAPNNNRKLSSYDQLVKLNKELIKREERFSMYGGSLFDKRTIDSLKQKINLLRESSSEKQVIPYQNSSNSMASCSA